MSPASASPRLLAAAAVLSLAACGANDPDTAPRDAAAAEATPALFTPQQIEQAAISAPATPASPAPTEGQATPAPVRPDPGLIRLQILLDRTAFSPGVIDGLPGDNTRQAIAAFRDANDLDGDDRVDQALLQRLAQADAGPVMTIHVLTATDIAGPFSPPPPEDVRTQAQTGSHYTSARERLAERFHITEDLLQALNPAATFSRAGERIAVPAVSRRAVPEITRIVVDKDDRSVRTFDGAGRLVAFYPATIGSSDMPTPSGTLRVVGVADAPDYAYDPAKLSYAKGTERVVVPAGPNNPVGSVWIDLSKDTYGIHGTPDPTKIAKTASHGCVRLTNWDVEELAAAVKPGVQVRFV